MSFSAELRAAAAPAWDAQLAHPFVRGIGDGTLPEERFRFYVRQDYLFLIDYGRLLSLAAARAPRLEWMRRFAALAGSVLETEMDLHRQFAARWGITAEQLEAERTAPATDAYCDFLLRTAALGDFAELVAALLPCMWGYAEVGRRLSAAGAPEHEGYAEWIAMYASEEFGELAGWCRGVTDAVAEDVSGAGRRRMHAAFRASSEHELAFWESAWAAR
ncbi:MAG: thiaminase II [Solirubrobacteraceae bacterium]